MIITEIDYDKCDSLAAELKDLQISGQPYGALPTFVDPETSQNFFFLAAAIIPQSIFELSRINWEHLKDKFIFWSRNLSESQLSRQLAFHAPTLARDFISLYNRDDQLARFPEDPCLILTNIGTTMLRFAWNGIEDIYSETGGYLFKKDSKGLIKRLLLFRAFSNPLHDKKHMLLSLMENAQLWQYHDPEVIGPYIDDQIIMELLRSKCLVIEDQVFTQNLVKTSPLELDDKLEMRLKAGMASNYMANQIGIPARKIHLYYQQQFFVQPFQYLKNNNETTPQISGSKLIA